MTLTKPNQELRRDLQGIASDLKWSAVELVQIAGRLSAVGNEPDAEAVRRMCSILRTEELRLSGLAEDIRGKELPFDFDPQIATVSLTSSSQLVFRSAIDQR